ncbi:glycosyltransferase family 4 protein [Microbacter sp. GSS18]|nr:glycosyltransferase family 4 protein [Microbacter sp. GSS18]
MPRTAVYNPGSHPALAWIAAALAGRGELAGYATALQFTSQERARLAALGLDRGLGARTLPHSLSRPDLNRTGLLADLAATYAKRRGNVLGERRWLTRRNRIVADTFTSMLWGEREPDVALVPTNTQSGVHRHLDRACRLAIYTPLPYLPVLHRLMDGEAVSNPRWSTYLQFRSTGRLESDPHAKDEAASAAVVVANSRFTASTYSQELDKPLIVAPLAIPPKLLARTEVQREADARGPIKLLFAGQMSQRKGLSYLFEAIESLRTKAVALTLVGPDPLKMVPELARAYPSVEMSYVGSLDQESLWALMGAHHALVFPSLAEGYGNVINEALAHGLPVIASDRTGAVDAGLHGRAGLVFSAGSADPIAGAIDFIAGDSQTRRDYSGEARTLATSLGGWDSYGDAVAVALAAILRPLGDTSEAVI